MLRKNQTTVVRLLLSNLDYLLRLYQTIRILTNVCAIFFISLPLHFGLLIGTYFWEHIFESTLQQQSEAWSYGEVDLEDVSLRFLLFGCCILILFTLTLSFFYLIVSLIIYFKSKYQCSVIGGRKYKMKVRLLWEVNLQASHHYVPEVNLI